MKSFIIYISKAIKITSTFAILLGSQNVIAQEFPGLEKLSKTNQSVYYSSGAEAKAIRMAEQVAKVNAYYEKHLRFTPKINLLVLAPGDWKTYAAHPVYGMPHYKNDQTLVVASENNPFWKSFIPPLDKIPAVHADKIRMVYGTSTGEVNMEPFFDLLAIHELGHAYHFQDSIKMQRNWLSELFVNIFLHTYVAENEPSLLPVLTTFPEIVIALTDPASLQFTSLSDVHSRYDYIAINHPQNYGWYQCRWHHAAATIYDKDGVSALKGLWKGLGSENNSLDDQQLAELLTKVSGVVANVMLNWDAKK